VTSQSPPSAGTGIPPRNYVDAWMAIRVMVMAGASWSGRERNTVYLNLGEQSFADVSVVSEANSIGDGRCVATVDWDDDGRLDLFLKNRTAPRIQFFRNGGESDGAYLSVRLQGVTCNRDAIGAHVEVQVGERTLKKTLYAGDGYLSQSSKRLHFGLGKATSVERLSVLWPDGKRDDYTDLEIDTRYAILQGAAAPRKIAARPLPDLARVQVEPAVPATSPRARVPLLEKLPLAAVRIPAFDDPGRTVADLAGGPVFLNLWGTTCAACMKEFSEFEDRRDELSAAVRIVPLVVDSEGEHARARELLDNYGLAADAGVADAEFKQVLQLVLAEVLQEVGEVPLPTSLLLDGAGQLVAIYPGRVDVDELLEDIALVRRMNPRDPSDSRLTHGVRVLPRARDYEAFAQKFERIHRDELAEFYRRLGGQ
jgi:hypothetical protein